MPSYNSFPKDQVKPIEEPVKIVNDDYRGRLIDTAYTPMQNILLNIEGTRWTVEYFSQVMNTDNAISFGGPGKDDTYLQYRRVVGFELRVTNPLTSSQETSDNAMNLTGSSNVYPCLIPNVGDLFVADIGDGRKALFQVSHTQRMSIRKDSAFTIEYEAINYADGLVGNARYEDVINKTIETVYFDRDFVTHGQNPFVLKDDYADIKELRKCFYEISRDWTHRFKSNEYKTLLVPAQPRPVYDHFVSKAAHAILTAEGTNWELLDCRVLNFSKYSKMSIKTIWDMFVERTLRYKNEIATRVGTVHRFRFNNDPLYHSFIWTGIEYAVYPKDGDLPVDSDYVGDAVVTEGELSQGIKRSDLIQKTDMDDFCVYSDLDPDLELPWVYPSTKDGRYVLSNAFYENHEKAASVLEHQARAYLRKEALDPKKILLLAKSQRTWSNVDQFYQTLILLVLIIAVTRGY